jgi:aminomethyltransferase
MVVNAGNKNIDMAHFAKVKKDRFAGKDVTITPYDQSLIAIQGPKTAQVVKDIFGVDSTNMGFMTQHNVKLGKLNLNVLMGRLGYTGEDGFEVSVPHNQVDKFVDILLKDPRVKPIGLGARDSLRLEAGLCLHGRLVHRPHHQVW